MNETRFILGMSKELEDESKLKRRNDLKKIKKYLIRQSCSESSKNDETEEFKNLKSLNFMEFLYEVGMFEKEKKLEIYSEQEKINAYNRYLNAISARGEEEEEEDEERKRAGEEGKERETEAGRAHHHREGGVRQPQEASRGGEGNEEEAGGSGEGIEACIYREGESRPSEATKARASYPQRETLYAPTPDQQCLLSQLVG